MHIWLAASHNAREGSGWTSKNNPSIPAATPARARVGINSLEPPLGSELGIPYLRMEWVTSKITGYPVVLRW